jgi:hypothetical protein
MHSPEHKANILDHDFTQVGVGVSVDKNGIIWVTEDFRQPQSSATGHSTSTHKTTTRQATRPTTSAPRPTTAASRPVAPVAHPRTVTARPHPAATATPQAKLLARLTAMRTASAQASPDPVAAAFDYLSTVTDLTTAA